MKAGYWSLFVLLLIALWLTRPIINRPSAANNSNPPKLVATWTFCVLLLAITVLSATIWSEPVIFAQQIGTLAALVCASLFWSMWFSLLLVVIPNHFGAPSFAALPIFSFVLFGNVVDQHKLDAVYENVNPWELFGPDGIRMAQCLSSERVQADFKLDIELAAWLGARMPDRQHRNVPFTVPLFIVAGSGGGMRAAEFTASALHELEVESEGRFARHLFATSTVSGASLGVAVWAKANETSRNIAKDEASQALMERFLISNFFSSDYLTPIAGSMLLHDAAQRLFPIAVPGRSRATVLEESWQEGWRRAVDAQAPGAPSDFGMLSSRSSVSPPLSIFNATEVHTGRRFLISSQQLSQGWFPDAYLAISRCSLHGIRDMKLATAVHLSARFSFLSPAASIRGVPDQLAGDAYSSLRWLDPLMPPIPQDALWGQVVDGGYVENYGATTATEIVQAIRDSWLRLKAVGALPKTAALHIVGLSLVNDPFDLGNKPLDSVNVVLNEKYSLASRRPNGMPRVVEAKEIRFEDIWPIASSYDVRELSAMMGRPTPLNELLGNSRLATEAFAPVMTVLRTREARGITAERQFALQLDALVNDRGSKSSISGEWLDLRLGRMLRDRNLLRFSSGIGAMPTNPTLGQGIDSTPNPELAWFLSSRSRQSIFESLTYEKDRPSRYASDRDLVRFKKLFSRVCGGEPKCVFDGSLEMWESYLSATQTPVEPFAAWSNRREASSIESQVR